MTVTTALQMPILPSQYYAVRRLMPFNMVTPDICHNFSVQALLNNQKDN